jgi:hypothetical protein
MRRLVFRSVVVGLLMFGIAPMVRAQDDKKPDGDTAPGNAQDANQESALPFKGAPQKVGQNDACKKPAGADDPVKNRLIVVGAPKVYDDFYLQGLLVSLQNQLTNTHAIDQATLLSHIGVAQGADLRQTSTALSVSGPGTPGVQTFALPAGVPAFSYPPGYSTTTASSNPLPSGTATTTTPGTTTTTSSLTPSIPTPPPPALAVPAISSLGQSSLDTYNESLQLAAEIANTSLLLQPNLSDMFQRNGDPKSTFTIGFPITVETPSLGDKELAGAVAEVHVAICSTQAVEPPSIVTLLPRERTYNVASLVDKNFLGSAGAVLGGVVNVGGGFLWSHKRYYLVQQQETVAVLSPDESPAGCKNKYGSFAWQIRPVLGNEFIRPGNSVNFVQFSVASDPSWGTLNPGKNKKNSRPTKIVGTACVSVIWRKPAVSGLFRRKSDEYLGDEVPAPEHCYDIDYYNTLANQTLSVMDIGQGAVTVRVQGTFLPGTTVHLGNTYLTPDSIPATHDELTFTTLASTIVAADRVYFVGRDGREIEALRPVHRSRETQLEPPTISPYSDSQSLVKLKFKLDPSASDRLHGERGPGFQDPGIDPWVVVIGSKVFGLSDAPFFSANYEAGEIQLIVPTALIQVSPRIELRRLLWPNVAYRASAPILPNTFSKAAPAVSKSSILSSQNGLTIGLVGTGLDKVKMVFPSPDICPKCDVSASGSTFLRVTLPKPPEPKKDVRGKKTIGKDEKDKEKVPDPTEGLRQLAFCRKVDKDKADCDEQFPILVVDVPKLDSTTAKPSLEKHDPVPVNTHQVTIAGNLLDQVVTIEHAKLQLNFRLVPGKTPSLLVDLPDSIATIPGGYTMLVTFADKSTTAYLLTIQKSGS